MQTERHIQTVTALVLCLGIIHALAASAGESGAPELKAKAVWRHPKTGREMIYVPSSVIKPIGKSTFGADIPLAKDNRVVAAFKIVRQCPLFVTGFWMDKDEVTNEAYEKFLKATRRQPPASWAHGRYPEGQGQHAVQVSFEEAKAYADWAGLRIPKAQEFFAASANAEELYPWTDDLAFNKDLSIAPGPVDQPVGKNPKDVAPHGFRDLLGHALEWADTPMHLPKSSLTANGVFFLKDFGGGMQAWLADSAKVAHGFRCCVTPWVQLLSGDSTKTFEFSDRERYGYNTIKITVSNKSDSAIRFVTSSGANVKVEQDGSAELWLLAGTYLFATPSSDGVKASAIRFEVLAPEHETFPPWGRAYLAITVTEKEMKVAQ